MQYFKHFKHFKNMSKTFTNNNEKKIPTIFLFEFLKEFAKELLRGTLKNGILRELAEASAEGIFKI